MMRFDLGFMYPGVSGSGGADTTPPALDGSPEVLSDGYTVRVYFNELLNQNNPPSAGDFTFTDTPIGVASVTVGTDYIDLMGTAAFIVGEAPGVTHSPGANPIRDLAGNPNTGFSDVECDNNSEVVLVRPYGFGSSLKLHLVTGDGEQFCDFGTHGVLRHHDQSSFSNHGIMTATATRQPTMDPLGLDEKPCLVFDRDLSQSLYLDTLAASLQGTNTPFTVGLYGVSDVQTLNGAFFSCGHSSITSALHLHWPRSSGTPSGNFRARRTGDSTGDADRNATPTSSGTQRLLIMQFDGSVISGRVLTDPSSSTTLTWNNSAFSTGACTFNMCTIGSNRNSSSLTGALPWAGRFREVAVWNTLVPIDDVLDWATEAYNS